jgi:microcystin-dependent protein
MFAGTSAPTGWLLCDGSNVNRSTYPSLFNVVGETFGAGDGSTTFGLPDIRGEFVRGWDNGRGVDSGRSFGSFQEDEFKSHNHSNGAESRGGIAQAGGSATILRVTGTGSSGGDETRPRNVALNYIIKT